MSPEEFDQLYHGSYRRLVGQLYALTGNLAEAQDVVQEAFVRAWDHRHSLATKDDPEAWVRTVARRLAVSRWRKARNSVVAWRRHAGQVRPDAGPSDDTVALVTALRALSPTQREALALHYLRDLSIEQIAEETGTPAGTIKARLSRGRAALAEVLRSDDASPARPTSTGSTPTDPTVPEASHA